MRKIVDKIACFIILLTAVCGIIHMSSKDVYAAVLKHNIQISNVYSTVYGNKIKWTNSYSADGYEVYRSKNNGKFVRCDTVSSKTYTDTDIETGENYKYKIRAYKYAKGKKKYSSISSESILIKASPTGITKINVYSFSNRNVISWIASEQASGYKVYRSSNNIDWECINTIYINSAYCEDYNIDPSINYFYKVSAFEIVEGKEHSSVLSGSFSAGNRKGIDVSHHNGKINWKKVKDAGVSFAMIRLGYGTSKGGIVDRKLDYNYNQAKKYGIKIGFYLYSYADNTKEARNEAKFTIKLLKKYGDVDYPIAFDFENAYRNKKKYRKANTKIITAYCDYLENKGYDTTVYSYLDFLKKSVYHKKVSKYGIWLAKWTYREDNFTDSGISNVQMWQYSDRGKIKGIKGVVDLNLRILQV